MMKMCSASFVSSQMLMALVGKHLFDWEQIAVPGQE
jgi:hypothetical protein